MAFDTSGRRPLRQQIQIQGGFDEPAALTGTYQITPKSGNLLRLDANGAARDVTLPGIADGLEDSNGVIFMIRNTAAGAFALTVKDPGGATVATVGQNEAAIVVGAGAEVWASMGTYAVT